MGKSLCFNVAINDKINAVFVFCNKLNFASTFLLYTNIVSDISMEPDRQRPYWCCIHRHIHLYSFHHRHQEHDISWGPSQKYLIVQISA